MNAPRELRNSLQALQQSNFLSVHSLANIFVLESISENTVKSFISF